MLSIRFRYYSMDPKMLKSEYELKPKPVSRFDIEEETVPKSLYDELFMKFNAIKDELRNTKKDLARQDKALLILRARFHIEELENKFLPPIMRSMTRKQKWTAILTSSLPDFVNNIELIEF